MKKIISLTLAVIMLLPLLSALVSASADNETHLTAGISKNGQYIEIEATFSLSDTESYKDKSLTLFASPPGAALREEYAVQKDVAVKSHISLQALYKDKRNIAYVLAVKGDDGDYTAVTNYAYTANQDVIAPYTYEYPEANGKKGLDITLFADAQLSGVSHTVIKVPLNEYIVSSSSDATSYKSEDTTYYYDKNKISSLDHKIKTYSDAGIRVYLQLLLTKRLDGQPEYFYFSEAGDAEYYAINVYSKQASDALYAFVSYLTEKYTSENRAGFCGSYILGCEVNSNRYTNNAGVMSLSEYTEAYSLALRIVDSAARFVYSNARVYVSVANNFNKSSYDNNNDSTLDYPVLGFLSHLSDIIKDGGDIPWRVSVDPYNIDRSKADFKGAEGSEYSYDARYITMDNINILTSLLSQPSYMYNGQRRPVIIGEISYPANGCSEAEQKAQAAAYALAYYKAEANEQIEAIIYKDQVDNAADKTNPGLFTRSNETEDTADSKKAIYRVFRYIDTDQSNSVTEQYLSYYGITTWGEIVSGYSLNQPQRRTVISGSGTTDVKVPSGLSLKRVFDFGGGDAGFYPSENARVMTVEKDDEAKKKYGSEYSLAASLNMVASPEYRGVSANGSFDISGAEYAVLDMKITSDTEGLCDVMLRMNAKNGNGADVIYEGTASAEPGKYYRLYFDISEFTASSQDEANRISVWIRPHKAEDNAEYKLYLNGVSFEKQDQKAFASSVAKTVIVTVICTAALAGLAYGVMFLRSVVKSKRKTKRI